MSRLAIWGMLMVGAFLGWACSRGHSSSSAHTHTAQCACGAKDIGSWTAWPKQPKKTASSHFWKYWGDGKAELSGYTGVSSRYGQLRKAEAVMIFVTEPMNRNNWIKDDSASTADRVNVLKLNYRLTFQTGIYPYAIMTSVFSPVDLWAKERFRPSKLTLSVHEWCGHVFAGIWPGQQRYMHKIISYFASEGEQRESIAVPTDALYEDALWIQLRELEGPFAEGKAWRGKLVPMLWWQRRQHIPSRPLTASLTRTVDKAKGATKFTLRYEGRNLTRTIWVEQAWPKRILGWASSEGEQMKLSKTARLPYWGLNSNGDEKYRKQLGLSVPGGN